MSTSSTTSTDKKHSLQRRWTYWELRNQWQGNKQDWSTLPTSLFDVDTVEDFWICYNRCPKIVDVFDDGRYGARNTIERDEQGDGIVRTGAQGYMLFQHGLKPDTKFEINGERVIKNGYRTEVSCSASDFEAFQHAWEATVLSVIGEVLDPKEYIAGVYLTDKHRGKAAALRLEVWFNVGAEADTICQAICAELVTLLRGVCELPFRFTKMQFFSRKHGEGMMSNPSGGSRNWNNQQQNYNQQQNSGGGNQNYHNRGGDRNDRDNNRQGGGGQGGYHGGQGGGGNRQGGGGGGNYRQGGGGGQGGHHQGGGGGGRY